MSQTWKKNLTRPQSQVGFLVVFRGFSGCRSQLGSMSTLSKTPTLVKLDWAEKERPNLTKSSLMKNTWNTTTCRHDPSRDIPGRPQKSLLIWKKRLHRKIRPKHRSFLGENLDVIEDITSPIGPGVDNKQIPRYTKCGLWEPNPDMTQNDCAKKIGVKNFVSNQFFWMCCGNWLEWTEKYRDCHTYELDWFGYLTIVLKLSVTGSSFWVVDFHTFEFLRLTYQSTYLESDFHRFEYDSIYVTVTYLEQKAFLICATWNPVRILQFDADECLIGTMPWFSPH